MLEGIKSSTVKQKIKWAVVVWLIATVAWTLTASTTKICAFSWQGSPTDTGFTQIVDGEEIALESIADFQEVEKGEVLILTYQLPTLTQETSLLFYSKDIEVHIYADDVEIYTFAIEEAFAFLKTPGNKWNSVELPVELSGAVLRIELTSQFANRYDSALSTMYFVENSETFSVLIRKDGFRVFTALLLFMMAFFAYVNAAVWKRPSSRTYYIRLGHVYLCTALWSASMCILFNYFIKKPVFAYVISVTMASFIAVMLCELASFICRKKNKAVVWLEYIAWGNFILQMILQFVFGISMLDLLPLTYIIYAGGAAAFLVLIIHHILTNKNNINFAFVTLLIVFCGAIVEIVVLCLFPERTDLIGFSGVMGLLLYLFVNHINILRYESKIDIEKLALEKNYNKLQNTTLMQQIKAHFFFNTLNTISALCKYDPHEADNAIIVFAQYMRSYMRLINEQENIDFAQELEIVEATLQIEKMRFPDTFTYEMNLEYTDFKMPPLCIQPIIENSMVHGLRKIGKAGKVSIQSKKIGDAVQITISDNGVGFDPRILEKSESIGLKNLQKRVKLMANGDVSVHSEIGKGTKTTLTIPL